MRPLSLKTKFAAAVGIAALAVGCSTAPIKKTEDAEAAKASRVYLDSVLPLPVSSRLVSDVICAVPAEAQKPAPGEKSGPSKDWKKLIAYANACAKAKSWGTLDTIAQALARADLNSPWGAYFQSLAAEGIGELQRAMWMADLAQKKAGGRAGLFAYQKGRILFAMKETARAMTEVQHAVELDSRLVDGHLFLADVYRRDLEPDRAVASYKEVLKNEGDNYRALTTLAELSLERGANAEAIEYYSKAVHAHPAQLQAWLRLAYIYETVQKNGAQALVTYRDLKMSIDRGSVRERPDFDLNAKIKALEQAIQASRAPAQAKAAIQGQPKSVKK